MDYQCWLLAQSGYQIIWVSGAYCRACRNDRDVILRWDGEGWLAL